MKKTIILLASLICMMTVSAQHPADYVNPFIGTSTNVEAPSGQLTNGVNDVRTAEEFKDGHIAYALNIDVKQDDFVKKALATLPKNKTVAVYCRSGRRSANAAGLLAKKGYTCVNLYGGILAWIEAGKSVVQNVKE